MNAVPGSRIIALAARLVPPAQREAWRREWEAEAVYAWRLATRKHPHGSVTAALRLRIRTLSCILDALCEGMRRMKMTGFLNDMHFAVRGLLRYPGFTLIAGTTLALGIGATTAVFTLVDGVLLKPLPFDEADRLVAIQHLGRDGRDEHELPMSTGLYLLYADQAPSLEGLGLYAATTVTLVNDGKAERVASQVVTPGFFEVLRVQPTQGRTFSPAEGAPDGERVVILSDGLWRSHFGAEPSILGRTLDINGVSRQVVGVMPPDFGHPERSARLWLPFVVDPARAPLAAFGADGVGRLASGASAEGLSAELEGLISRLDELYPDSGAPAFLNEVGLRPLVLPLKEAVVGEVTATLWILLGTVAFVLLIACANVANLLLVRAEGRQRELALRVALGAGRMQVLRTSMSESIVLAAGGGLLGIIIATAAIKVTTAYIPADLPRMAEVGVDGRVLGFTALIVLGSAIFFGLFPLIRYGVADLATQLRDGGGHGATGGPDRHRLRNGLVVVQVALALVLLVGSGLMLRSFIALRSVDPGFNIEGILTARLSVPTAEIEGWAETDGFYRELRDRLAAQPGVEAVGFSSRAPLTGGLSFFSIEVEDHPRGPDELPVFATVVRTSPGYFEALDIDLVEGRRFRPDDGAEGARSAVVSESFARHWWPDASPLGRRLTTTGPDDGWFQIVGVVQDVHPEDLQAEAPEIVYMPTTVGDAEEPIPTRTMDVVVKTTLDPMLFLPILRREVQAINARIPLSNARSMEDVFNQATARTSFTMAVLGSASGVALLLGLVGIYGVISYVVSQRTREIGVRMALGASGSSVQAMVVRQGLLLATVGVVLGLVAAGLLSSVMGSILYGVSATDPVTYAAVAAALVVVATAASWLPAMRAAGVDPARALRAE